MKKLFAFAAALLMCLSFASCGEKKPVAETGTYAVDPAKTSAGEQLTTVQVPRSDVEIKQAELIDSFGITTAGKSLVCYASTTQHREYIEYIVCKYNEDGSRKSQNIYVIYVDPSYYRNGKAEHENKRGYEADDDSESVKYTCELFAAGGTYAKDYQQVKTNMAEYTIVDNIF